MTPLLVLAGGFGTRLRPAVSDVPKPLAPVGQRPYLHYLIRHWREQGAEELIFLLHHQADTIVSFLSSEDRAGEFGSRSPRTITEPEPMGTGGAVAYAVRELRLTGSFLVSNADTWLGTGIEALLNTPPASMAIVEVTNSERYGSVVTKGNKVVEFKEKSGSSGAGWINAGLYHLNAAMFAGWDGAPFSLERDLFQGLAAAELLSTVALDTDFIDIGVPEDYYRFCRWVESGRAGQL